MEHLTRVQQASLRLTLLLATTCHPILLEAKLSTARTGMEAMALLKVMQFLALLTVGPHTHLTTAQHITSPCTQAKMIMYQLFPMLQRMLRKSPTKQTPIMRQRMVPLWLVGMTPRTSLFLILLHHTFPLPDTLLVEGSLIPPYPMVGQLQHNIQYHNIHNQHIASRHTGVLLLLSTVLELPMLLPPIAHMTPVMVPVLPPAELTFPLYTSVCRHMPVGTKVFTPNTARHRPTAIRQSLTRKFLPRNQEPVPELTMLPLAINRYTVQEPRHMAHQPRPL